MANIRDIVVNSPEDELNEEEYSKNGSLVAWVTTHVDSWIDHRDMNYRDKFEEYWRLWKGVWDPKDKTRKSERSRLISPATQQAVESTTAELEEATFGKGKYWIDLEDDVEDEMKEDMLGIRDLLIQDMEKMGIPNEIAKIFLYGSIFGTGIGKVIIDRKMFVKPIVANVQKVMGTVPALQAHKESRVVIGLEAIHPLNFAIDPAARTIEEAKGCAHIIIKPSHGIKKKQRDGIYLPGDFGTFNEDSKIFINDEKGNKFNDNYTKIVEYHGLVPRGLIEDQEEDIIESFRKELSEEKQKVEWDESDMVEAIVTIANDGFLLRAVANPNVMEDRGFIAYQHDTVPNSFWGRGVCEKGYNPQKALDADLRSRIDALALITHPMMAMDATRLPRGQKLSVAPGRTLLTNGNPGEILMPFHFGNLETSSFMQTADLERQIQVGTGAMDTAAPNQVNARNNTVGGMSMVSASMLKRQKRTKQNIDRQFLSPLIEKVLWRYMQYAPQRYPAKDYQFRPITSMGLMAREYEQAQLTNLLNVMPKEGPMFGVILKGILQNSSVDTKKELIDGLEQFMQPDPQQQQVQQLLQELQLQNAALENEKLRSEAAKNMSQAEGQGNKLETDRFNAVTNRITAITNANKGATNE